MDVNKILYLKIEICLGVIPRRDFFIRRKDEQPSFSPGKKTAIRPINIETDLDKLWHWINDPRVTKFLKARLPISLIEERKHLESISSKISTDVHFAVDNLQGELIGIMSIHKIKPFDRTATTGALLGPEYWGQGLGTDAKLLILDFAFNTLNMRKMSTRVHGSNKRSQAYCGKCGYKQEGREIKAVFKDGRYEDLILYGLFKKDFLKVWRDYQKS